MNVRFAMILLSSLALVACGGDDDGDDGSSGTNQTTGSSSTSSSTDDHAVDDHVCEHLEEGPFEDITATETATGAPELAETHVAYKITLPDNGVGGFQGVVTYRVAQAADLAFIATADIAVTVQDGAGDLLSAEDTCRGSSCSETCSLMQSKQVFPMDGAIYTLTIGPTSMDSVIILVEEAAHEH
ncbi:hypothetical protein [Chondromyces apiculatus]|uniref:Lipoprotein n=1 Tax=Chondromyces apiculatus DSM 436 TaxID=1192034 RepID=A0A017SXG4_9BACT|nr:hypothetical protein [Chondromyces apiculatus]EYF01669.1 Hypothetical protein CAP_7874 [Chondromyces apiculatus DSM 436]